MSQARDFDWSVDDDPVFDRPEPAPPPAPRGPAWWRRLVRWQTAVIVMAAIALVAAGLALDRWRQEQALIAAVQAVVTLEDEARLAQDREALADLWRLYDPNLTRPLVTPGMTLPRVTDLHPELLARAEAGRVIRVDRLDVDLVRAYVARRFRDWVAFTSEQNTTWLETQFYRYVDDGWRRVDLERAQFDTTLQHAGRRVDWEYGPLDREYVETWAPVMDDLLDDACQQVDCPPDTRIRLALVASGPETFGVGPSQVWLQYAISSGSVAKGFVRLTTPARRGLPGDPVNQAAERRELGSRVLAALHLALRPEGRETWVASRVIARVMWTRLSDRLGLEPLQPSGWLLPDPGTANLDDLAGTTPLRGLLHDGAGLQVLINRLLRDQDPAAEARLLRALDTATDAETWLAEGLALTPEAARQRLQQAAAPLRLPLAETGTLAYAVSCADGIRLASPGDTSATALIEPGLLMPDYAPTWSPDGQRLATYSGLIFDLVRREVYSVSNPVWQAYGLTWLSPTSIAYVGYFGVNPPGAQAYVFHLDQPGAVQVLDGVAGIVPSPDGRWLAVLGSGGEGPDQQIGLVPNDGTFTAVTWIGAGSTPLWSPDSRRLVYFTNPNGYNVHPTVNVVTLDAAGPGAPRALADLHTAFRPEGQGYTDAWAFTETGRSLTFRYTAIPNQTAAGPAARQYGARLDLETGQLNIRRWPEDTPTSVWPIQGLGLIEILPERDRLIVRDQIDGFPLRSVDFDLAPDLAMVSGSAESVLFSGIPDSYVWRDPLDPASQPTRLEVPCLFPMARPGSE